MAHPWLPGLSTPSEVLNFLIHILLPYCIGSKRSLLGHNNSLRKSYLDSLSYFSEAIHIFE